MKAVAAVHSFRKFCAIVHVGVMALASGFVLFQLHDQNTHLTPPATFTACILGAVGSAPISWYLAALYLSPRTRSWSFLLVPLALVVLVSFVAGLGYFAAEPIFFAPAREGLMDFPANLHWVLMLATSFAGLSAPVFLPLLPVCGFIIWRKRSRHDI